MCFIEMDDIDPVVIGGTFIMMILLLTARKRLPRRFRVHPYLQQRSERGRFHTAVSIYKVVVFVTFFLIVSLCSISVPRPHEQ